MSDPITPPNLVKRGEALYEQQLKALLEPVHRGKFLAIEVDSGDYEIDEEDIVAIDRLHARHPNTVGYLMRIGYPAAYSMCGWREENQ